MRKRTVPTFALCGMLLLGACSEPAPDVPAQMPSETDHTVESSSDIDPEPEPGTVDEAETELEAESFGDETWGDDSGSEGDEDDWVQPWEVEKPIMTHEGERSPEELTARGHLPKQIGEPAFVLDTDGRNIITITLLGIEHDVRCTNPEAAPPLNDTFLGFHFKVEATGSNPINDTWDPVMERSGFGTGINMWEKFFTLVDSTGASHNNPVSSNGGACLDKSSENYLPASMHPQQDSRIYEGMLVIDASSVNPTGLIYHPAGSDRPGWEWEL